MEEEKRSNITLPRYSRVTEDEEYKQLIQALFSPLTLTNKYGQIIHIEGVEENSVYKRKCLYDITAKLVQQIPPFNSKIYEMEIVSEGTRIKFGIILPISSNDENIYYGRRAIIEFLKKIYNQEQTALYFGDKSSLRYAGYGEDVILIISNEINTIQLVLRICLKMIRLFYMISSDQPQQGQLAYGKVV